MSKPLTVVYKQYEHFCFVPKELMSKLLKLNLGKYGIMRGLVEHGLAGYVRIVERWDNDVRNYVEEFIFDDNFHKMLRYISVAFVGVNAVGWCITDDDKMFNVYVAKKYRKLGIAQKLTYLWARDNPMKIQKNYPHLDGVICHNDDAEALLLLAATKLKLTPRKKKSRRTRHVIHRLPK